jgi:hypothetical protein
MQLPSNKIYTGEFIQMTENKGTGWSGMGINYKGSQDQTERAVVL